MLAEALRDWLPGVLQMVQPWMSAVDMQAGARWNVDLSKELETSKLAIICVTLDNQNAPWMLFEAGALSNVVGTQCVIPYLLDMKPSEVNGPLVQFQAAVAARDGTFKVLSAVNRSLETLALSSESLERSFAKWWPDLEATIASIPRAIDSDPPPRPDRELLEEILNLSRHNIREQIERAAIAEHIAMLRQQDMMTMTHQLQAPLISVAGALALAAKRDATGTAGPLIEHAHALVEDVLALGYGIATALAAEAGRMPALNPVAIDVPEEVEKLAARIQRTNARKDLRFVFRTSVGFPSLALDKTSFTSVAYSLIHNALKYADRNSEITIEYGLEAPDGMPVLRIKSIGEPIAPSERERVFRKFERGSGTASGRFHAGVGLGLWVARALMRQLGGDVTLDLRSDDPQVTIFVVHFGAGAAT